jgi:hypothetical protein
MKSIAAKELKANLDAVLSSAQGERIVISRHGKSGQNQPFVISSHRGAISTD